MGLVEAAWFCWLGFDHVASTLGVFIFFSLCLPAQKVCTRPRNPGEKQANLYLATSHELCDLLKMLCSETLKPTPPVASFLPCFGGSLTSLWHDLIFGSFNQLTACGGMDRAFRRFSSAPQPAPGAQCRCPGEQLSA